MWPSTVLRSTKGEKAYRPPATMRAPARRETWPARANAAQPDTTGASRLAALNDATGPKRSVTGASSAAGASQLVLERTLTPPKRAHSVLVRSGLCPWPSAHGSHSSHHTCCDESPQLHVMVWAGSPPSHTCAHTATATAR